MTCQLCDKSNFQAISHIDAKSGQELIVSICGACGLVQQTPMPTGEELRQFYAHSYRTEYKGVKVPKPKHVLRAGKVALNRIDFLSGKVTTPVTSVLDIGAGGGGFLYMLKMRSFASTARGVEPNIGYCQYAKDELGVSIDCAELDSVTGSYQMITMFHVLEHLVNPRRVFRKLHELLAPNGLVFIEVPWHESYSQSPSNIYFKAHTLYFSVATLTACASEYFTSESVDTSSGNLRMLLRRRAEVAALELPPSHSVRETARCLQKRGWITYLLKGGGLLRPIQKIFQTLAETKVRSKSGKSILNELVKEKETMLTRRGTRRRSGQEVSYDVRQPEERPKF